MRKSVTILACISALILLFASLSWAGNWVTKSYGQYKAPQFTPYLKTLIKAGDVYDMGVVRSADMPMWPGHPKFLVLNYKYHGETNILEPATFENDLVMMCSHSGTHMDAFNHIGERQADGRILLYGGKTADEVKEWWGMNWMSGADMTPVICRAIMLDFCKYFGEEMVYKELTPADIKGCMEAQGIKPMPDVPTAILIRTGYIKYWLKGPEEVAKLKGHGGPNVAAQKYMNEELGAVVTGADSVSYEWMPNAPHPVHRWMLMNGYIQNELLNLEGLAADGVYEGVYIALPLKIRGTSGSNIDPIFIH
jgi:kynurenine formamidase